MITSILNTIWVISQYLAYIKIHIKFTTAIQCSFYSMALWHRHITKLISMMMHDLTPKCGRSIASNAKEFNFVRDIFYLIIIFKYRTLKF